MKIVVFGALKRTGALHDGSVVDLSYAYAKYLRERTDEPNPLEMAEIVVPSELSRLIEGGSRTLDEAVMRAGIDGYRDWRGVRSGVRHHHAAPLRRSPVVGLADQDRHRRGKPRQRGAARVIRDRSAKALGEILRR